MQACLHGCSSKPTAFDPAYRPAGCSQAAPAKVPKATSLRFSLQLHLSRIRSGEFAATDACQRAGKWLAMAHLVHMTIRLVQNWDFEMSDTSEQIIWPRFEPHPENGLMLQRG